MATDESGALRKRQQIDSSKKTMFIMVAAVAFISGVSVVVSFFLIQQIRFHVDITSTKQSTINTINKNIKSAKRLKDEVRVLDTNEALSSARLKEDSSALQTILDALPAEANADALGASLQQVFAQPIDGLRLDSLSVDSIEDSSSPGETGEIGFRMAVSGDADSLKELLKRFEKSIRVIRVSQASVEVGKEDIRMTIYGEAFYQTAQKVGTKDKKVTLGRGNEKN